MIVIFSFSWKIPAVNLATNGSKENQLIIDDLEIDGEEDQRDSAHIIKEEVPESLQGEEIETLAFDEEEEEDEVLPTDNNPGFEEKKDSPHLLSFLLEISRSSNSRSADLIHQYLLSSRIQQESTPEEFTPDRSFTEVEEFVVEERI